MMSKHLKIEQLNISTVWIINKSTYWQVSKMTQHIAQDSVRLDMVDAYKTYKQQWTSSGEKKLVKDASKALKEYQTRVNPDITDSTVNSHIGVSTFDYIFIIAVEN